MRSLGAIGPAEELKYQLKQLKISRYSGAIDCESRLRLEMSEPPFPKGTFVERNWKEIYDKERFFNVALGSGEELMAPIPVVMLVDNSSIGIRPENIEIVDSGKEWEPSQEIDKVTRRMVELYRAKLRKMMPYDYNDPIPRGSPEMVRLIRVEAAESKVKLYVQHVRYLHYVQTNLLIDYVISQSQKSLREQIHPDGALEKLGSSRCADTLGVNMLLATADNYVVLQCRSHKVLTFPCRIGPSASGAIIGQHLHGRSVMDAVIAGEVCEETGLDYSDVDNSTMKLLGIGRDVIRGGKPDMYFVGKTRLSGGEFETKWRNARSREETEKLIFVPAPFVDGIGAGEGVAFVNWVSDTMKSYELQDLSVSTPATMANIGLWVKGLLLEAKR